jgi:hypothetical protein
MLVTGSTMGIWSHFPILGCHFKGVTGQGYLMTFGWSVADLLASSLNQFTDRARHLNAIEPPLCVLLPIGSFPECRGLVALRHLIKMAV